MSLHRILVWLYLKFHSSETSMCKVPRTDGHMLQGTRPVNQYCVEHWHLLPGF